MDHVNSGAKTDMFRMRINPEIRKKVEAVYEKNGLTLTDAVNVFFQQSLNTGGFPFPVTADNAELIRAEAMKRLMRELDEGRSSGDPVEEAEVYRRFGVQPE